MMEMGFMMLMFVVTAGILIVLTVLGAALLFVRKFSSKDVPQSEQLNDGAVFLYENGVLVDGNRRAHELLSQLNAQRTDWTQLSGSLKERFSNLPAPLGTSEVNAYHSYPAHSATDGSFVTIEQWGSLARVTIHEIQLSEPQHPGPIWKVMQQALEDAPNPIWHTSLSGEVTWTNAAYKTLADTLGKASDPKSPVIFDNFVIRPDKTTSRTSITNKPKSQNYWYDVTSVSAGDGHTHYANDANAIVNAEVAQRNFVQTLTKTFAQLSIGLALFDRNRQLALFNPALIDLTSLPADFLSSRPNLQTFFDRLREYRMMPEPKNYSSWREQIAELVVAAADDRYCETWTLPSGVTYRVIGRPHPDGAIALLFEDISAEVSLTRRFRAELELGQSILDALDRPVAVFSPVGSLSFCNNAYQDFWDDHAGERMSDFSIDQAIQHWKTHCKETDAWAKIRGHALDLNKRGDQVLHLNFLSGDKLTLSVSTVHGGATLIVFDCLKQPSIPSRALEKITI